MLTGKTQGLQTLPSLLTDSCRLGGIGGHGEVNSKDSSERGQLFLDAWTIQTFRASRRSFEDHLGSGCARMIKYACWCGWLSPFTCPKDSGALIATDALGDS